MKVFKFGGASVKDADGIRNLGRIVEGYKTPLVVVVSAFGKTTNALEKVVNAKYGDGGDPLSLLEEVFGDHMRVMRELDLSDEELTGFVSGIYDSVVSYLSCKENNDYDRDYDQIVSAGELWSSRIIASWLKKEKFDCRWLDIRKILLTDNRFRDANILWQESENLACTSFDMEKNILYLTQGFIGGTKEGFTTTLGREGSDYTAAVIANMLNAEEVHVWKDVPGILNADPKWIEDALVMERVNYKEAVEMSFSGAKVIHPKTIKPLHNKNIPLYVRSFLDSSLKGTVITGEQASAAGIPVFIRKENQILISILSRDFSFAIGDNIARILAVFYEHGIKANMVQASAVSVAVCADDDGRKIRKLISELEKDYRLMYNTNVEMLTIRQYAHDSVEKVCGGREVLMEQKTRRTIRIVVKSY